MCIERVDPQNHELLDLDAIMALFQHSCGACRQNVILRHGGHFGFGGTLRQQRWQWRRPTCAQTSAAVLRPVVSALTPRLAYQCKRFTISIKRHWT